MKGINKSFLKYSTKIVMHLTCRATYWSNSRTSLFIIAGLMFSCFNLLGCSLDILNDRLDKSTNNNKQKTTDDTLKLKDGCIEVQIDRGFNPGRQTPKVMFSNPVIDGNFLKMDVGYSGCKKRTDDFVLIWNGVASKSLPPLITLTVVDSLTADAICEMYITDKLCFDLSLLKKEIPGRENAVRINLKDYDKELIYNY